jgi:hypothetical protein
MTALETALSALSALDLDSTSARDYAVAENAVRQAEMDEYAARGESMWCGMHPSDDAYWAQQAQYGIKTARDLVRRNLIQSYSDWYKELHGIRPRWVNFAEKSVEDLQDMLDALAGEAKDMEDESFWAAQDD